jgi:hypothetical protein
MVKIKMVAGQTYTCPPAFGPERVIVRGEVVDVADEFAQAILGDSYLDALGNEHFYFHKVSEKEAKAEVAAPADDDAAVEGDDAGEDGEPVAPAKTSRQRAPK